MTMQGAMNVTNKRMHVANKVYLGANDYAVAIETFTRSVRQQDDTAQRPRVLPMGGFYRTQAEAAARCKAIWPPPVMRACSQH